jgi:hypothetical protein
MLANRFLLGLLCAFALTLSPLVGEAKAPQQTEERRPATQPDETKLVEHEHYNVAAATRWAACVPAFV